MAQQHQRHAFRLLTASHRQCCQYSCLAAGGKTKPHKAALQPEQEQCAHKGAAHGFVCISCCRRHAASQLILALPAAHLQAELQSPAAQNSVPQRDADLLHLWTMVERAAPGQAKASALARLSAEASKRVVTDAAVRSAVHALLHKRRTGSLLQV